MSKKKIVVLFPAFLAIILSIFAIWFYGFERVEFGDAADYIDAANSILNGTAYPRHGEFHPVFRAPVFPAFIALIWTVFPKSLIAFKIAQAFLIGASCFVIYKITYELVQKNSPAFLAASICAVNPLLFGHTVDFYSEPLQILLVAISIFILIKLLKSEEKLFYKSVLLGIFFGLAALCRPTIFPIVLCLIPFIFLLFVRNKKQKLNYFAASCLITFGLFATIAPWTYFNYRTTGEFIPIVNGFGYNFWLGNHPDTLRLYEGTYTDKADNKAFADYWAGELPAAKIKELEQTDDLSSLPFNEQEKVWRREAFKNIEANPAITARLFWGKVKSYWTPFLNVYSYPFPLVVLVAILVIAIYLLSPYGAFILWQDEAGRKLIILFVIEFIAATLIHAMIIGNVRYRVPYIDPYLAMLSGIAIWHIAVKFFPNIKLLKS
jgi:hypothetical protein